MSEKTVSAWFGKITYEMISGTETGSGKKESPGTETHSGNDTFRLISAETAERDIPALAERYLSLPDDDSPEGGVPLRDLAVASGFCTAAEYIPLLREVSIRAAQMKVSASLTPDRMIIQAVEALDDINETINHLSERLSEWYGVYYPEMSFSGEESARFICGNAKDAALSEMGAPLGESEAVLLKSFAGDICGLYDRKNDIEAYISSKMNKVAPNVSMIAGDFLGARLISMSGGLSRLASFPSGTIQVMGAEKALFRHLRSRGPSPKHGIIFSHPLINTAAPRLRGKLARSLAASISLAARTDVYTGVLRPEIQSALDEKTEKIRASGMKSRGVKQ
ncbi:MAG: NOP58 family protein [Methanosarcinaceae archaeon]|nr:NOP58 family protein [Methanosarcinaceae archaeon]